MLHKGLNDFLMGLFFGMGFFVANNVLNFIGQFLHAAPLH